MNNFVDEIGAEDYRTHKLLLFRLWNESFGLDWGFGSIGMKR